MATALPTPEELSRWLLQHEAGPDPTHDVLAAAAVRLYGQLRAGLVVYLGPTGFDTLWSRAMHLAHGAPPPGAHDAAAPNVTLPPQVPAVVLARSAVAASEALSLTFASVFALLFTLLGAPLGLRLLRHAWPALPMSVPLPQTGDTE